MRRRRAFLLAFITTAIAACGDVLGGDDDATPPPRANDSGSIEGAVSDDAGDAANGEAATDGGACVANGSLDLDPAFAPATGLLAPRAATSSAGEVVVVGRCGDGGAGLEMAFASATGAVSHVPACFGSTSTEMVMSVSRTSAGYVVATNRQGSPLRARATHVSAAGADVLTEELAPVAGYNGSFVKFAVEVGAVIVWGGLRTQFSTPDRGFLKVMTKSSIEFAPGEVPVSATVAGGKLYVAFIRAVAATSEHEIYVRRYDVAPNGTLAEDVAFLPGTPPVLDLAFTTIDGVGGMVVDGDAVTIAAGYGGTTRLLRLANGVWSQELVPVFSPARIVRSCDGSSILGGSVYLDGSANTVKGLVRRAGGATNGELKMPAEDEITDLLTMPNGDLYVVQATGTVRRVSP